MELINSQSGLLSQLQLQHQRLMQSMNLSISYLEITKRDSMDSLYLDMVLLNLSRGNLKNGKISLMNLNKTIILLIILLELQTRVCKDRFKDQEGRLLRKVSCQ
jgi:hypothetical protein